LDWQAFKTERIQSGVPAAALQMFVSCWTRKELFNSLLELNAITNS